MVLLLCGILYSTVGSSASVSISPDSVMQPTYAPFTPFLLDQRSPVAQRWLPSSRLVPRRR